MLNLRKINDRVQINKRLEITKSLINKNKVKNELANLFKPYANSYITDNQLTEITKQVCNLLTHRNGIVPKIIASVKNNRLDLSPVDTETWELIKFIYKE